MDPQSSSSSDDESDSESSRNITHLADLLWHKVKKRPKEVRRTSPKSTETLVAEDGIGSQRTEQNHPSSSASEHTAPETQKSDVPSSQDISNFVSKMMKSKTEKKQQNEKKTVQPSTSSKSSIRSLFDSNAKEALKHVKTTVEPYKSPRQQKKEAKLEKSQWKWGKGKWASMRMPEMTQEIKNDLMVLGMRSTIDPTRHYKHNDLKMPKFVQIGTEVKNPYTFYQDRVPKKKRKATLVDELMADEEFQRNLKKQYDDMKAITSSRKAVYQGKAPRRIKKQKLKRRG